MSTILTLTRRLSSKTASKMTFEDLVTVFGASVSAVNPSELIKNRVKVTGSHLQIINKTYEMKKPVYVVGFGKAVCSMAKSLERILDTNLKAGICNIPTGTETCNEQHASRILFIEGATNNLPDISAYNGAKQIQNLVENLQKDDILIVLVSGGGSALLPLPKHGVLLETKLELIKALGKKGANITELNIVRKQLSLLKGGGLAKLAHPAKVISLILSDVLGDPLDIIASGPTVPNKNTNKEAIDVLNRYGLYENSHTSIKNTLNNPQTTDIDPKNDIKINKNGYFDHVDNFILGNNTLATTEAFKTAESLGYSSVVLSTMVQGNVDEVADVYVELVGILVGILNRYLKLSDLNAFLCEIKDDFQLSQDSIAGMLKLDFCNKKGICIISSGEPTVKVTGAGKGGRNQQLALEFSVKLHEKLLQKNCAWKNHKVNFLSCGTDGIDGPTDAAGAVGYPEIVDESLEENLDPNNYLKNNDCYNFYSSFKDGKYLIKTGHTGTNVMDIHVLTITK